MTVRRRGHSYKRLSFGPVAWRIDIRPFSLGLLFLLLLVFLAFVALATGSGEAGLAELLDFMTTSRPAGKGAALSIVGDLRMPRVIMALTCGAVLGLAGASLQTLTRNGLADPGLLGVREGASLAVVVLMLSLPAAPVFLRPIVGMAGGLAAACAVMGMAGSLARMRFILVGIGLSWLLAALTTLILTAAEVDNIQAAMVWMAGSLASVSPNMVQLALVCLLTGGGLLFLTAREAEISRLGDPVSTGLGVRLHMLAAVRIMAPVLLTAAAVSCVGSLGFVGLVAPHMARLTLGGGQVSQLSGSAIFGAALVLTADTLGRTLFAPTQIPAGIVLAIIGVPVLLILLWRRRNQI